MIFINKGHTHKDEIGFLIIIGLRKGQQASDGQCGTAYSILDLGSRDMEWNFGSIIYELYGLRQVI